MQKYVAFVSGLPFGKKSISDDELALAFLRLGFMNPRAMLNSGNIIFETHPVGVVGPLEAQISRYLKKTFNLDDVWTFIRTPRELQQMQEELPFAEEVVNDEGNSIFVVLLSGHLDPRTRTKLQIKRNDVDQLLPTGREVYWLRRSSSKGEHIAPPPISEILDSPATVRSLHAIQQILDEIEHPTTKQPKLVKLDDATRSEQSRH
jgi:uncharacterized protein (DUF1697 family)